MNKLMILSLLVYALLLGACSKTTAFDFFSTDRYYERAVSNMQKATLMRDAETKAILHAVYLNKVDPELYQGDDYFYVAVHIMEDSTDPLASGLFNPDYSLKVLSTQAFIEADDPLKQPEYDGKESDEEVFESDEESPSMEVPAYVDALEVTELDRNDKLCRTMPVRNRWNHFYLLRFAAGNSSVINLLFESDQYGKAALAFQKEQ